MGVATIGVLGGAFDPPHVGHVALARGALGALGLQRLLVLVVADPGHKEVTTPAGIRLALARLAFAELNGVEVGLDAHARTVDSLAELELPDPVFVVGADEFAGFLAWKEPARVLELARLAVGTRSGYPRALLDAVLDALPHPERVLFFEIPPVAASSSEVRERAARGEELAGLVPPRVAAEIARLRLYRRA